MTALLTIALTEAIRMATGGAKHIRGLPFGRGFGDKAVAARVTDIVTAGAFSAAMRALHTLVRCCEQHNQKQQHQTAEKTDYRLRADGGADDRVIRLCVHGERERKQQHKRERDAQGFKSTHSVPPQ